MAGRLARAIRRYAAPVYIPWRMLEGGPQPFSRRRPLMVSAIAGKLPGMSAWLLACTLLIAVAAVLQVAIPRVAERRVERRLAEGGGEALVSIEALPALRLLRRGGDRIFVRGRGLRIGMSREGGGLTALDGFDEVEILLSDFSTGPFRIAEFELFRRGSGPYRMRAEAQTSGGSLLDYGGEQLGGPSAPLLGLIARGAPLGGRPIPVSVEVVLSSRGGMLSVASGGGTVAGYPAGPVATMIAAAVARRLEITD
jgi:hypothetical protein